ncbi:chaplin family protein [Streptomyces sp. NPDC002446]
MNTAKRAAPVVAGTALACAAAAGSAFAGSGAQADGKAANPPGTGSGNIAQAPVHCTSP